jgi:ribonucleoside-diphosphate reductase alpha chain
MVKKDSNFTATSNQEYLTTDIARHIWASRYQFRNEQTPGDTTIADSWHRVARAVSAIEGKASTAWERRFFSILEGFRFLPGGRILAGSGTKNRVTLFNCFVMGTIQDNLEAIFEHIKQGAVTMQAGGGVGYDFSTLRPMDSPALASGRIASGPVSFMQIWDATCATIMSTGARRGAMIATLRCDHPDIEQFIEAKQAAGALRHFNLSVQITDAFMQAVRENTDWPLIFPLTLLDNSSDSSNETLMRNWPGYEGEVPCRVFRHIPARALWQKMMKNCYETAEPGVLFIDRINQLNNLGYCETITTTNPCGEVPLPPYGACNLGSINLTAFVRHAFTKEASLDLEGIKETVSTATRLLDDVIDLSEFPLPQQAEQARASRRIGLGLTGLADALIMLGHHYGDDSGRSVAAQIMKTLCHSAYRSSIELAREKGPFPQFNKESYLARPFIQSLPDDIRSGIAEHGIRNSHLTAIAPAGTISLLAGNISSGIEPAFAFKQTRSILNDQGDYEQFEIQDYAFRLWEQTAAKGAPLPDCFVSAYDLVPESHLQMQSVLQPYVDNAISKTINIPEDFPFADFCSLYERAYELGLKGCTTFRPNPARPGVVKKTNSGRDDVIRDIHCCSIDREES